MKLRGASFGSEKAIAEELARHLARRARRDPMTPYPHLFEPLDLGFSRQLRRARPGSGGYAGVGSEGYLINRFVAERTHNRTDAWGGSAAHGEAAPVRRRDRAVPDLGRRRGAGPRGRSRGRDDHQHRHRLARGRTWSGFAVRYERIDDAGLHVTVDGKPRLLEVDTVVVRTGRDPCGTWLRRCVRRPCTSSVTPTWPPNSSRSARSARARAWRPRCSRLRPLAG
ncbi:hypothetical protein I6J71_42430 [Amycolatopsis sp. FDAARGOS 1241]|nr:hypothetical protein I6J71_42430 [Amycolatopsis sp. FDAARGOS 1241]